MDMTSKDDIGASVVEQLLHGLLHVVPLALVGSVGVVPRRMDDGKQPGRLLPVDLGQVRLQPPVLVGFTVEISVGAEHDDVDAMNVEGVVEVGG